MNPVIIARDKQSIMHDRTTGTVNGEKRTTVSFALLMIFPSGKILFIKIFGTHSCSNANFAPHTYVPSLNLHTQ